MSTAKIKTEPTTAAATATVTAAAAVDVKVKLKQHASDIDTKVEPDSEADSDIKSESEDDNEDTDQNQFTITPKKQRRWICEYIGCGRSFKKASCVSMHGHEHRLKSNLNVYRKTYILTRQSLDDRWSCPLPDCETTAQTVNSLCGHIHRDHVNTLKQQQLPSQMTQRNYNFLNVDNFFVDDTRCGYHNTIGVLICHECRLVPECLLTHLQQKHGYDEKSIDRSALIDSAVNANADPNINQHTNNPHLAAAIHQPYQQHYQDIVQGWLCVTSDCGYCGYTADNKAGHKKSIHQRRQLTTVPALILRVVYAKPKASYFLITRIDQASGAVMTSSNRVKRHKLDYTRGELDTQKENGDDVSQNETTDTSNQKQQYSCGHPNCERYFNSVGRLKAHRREHSHEAVVTVAGTTYTLTRQSLNDRWPCPIPDCEMAYKTAEGTHVHILKAHDTLLKQKRANMEDSDSQQQHIVKKKQHNTDYLKVNDFYVVDTRCGYHSSTGLFICHKCRLVPECLLTHLQQTHELDEKSIINSALPESAVAANADPNINQHISNPHLAAIIHDLSQRQHPDIVQGWLCVTSDCGYCGFTRMSRSNHHREHRGNQLMTVPALVLRLLYAKIHTSSFFITRLDTITISNAEPDNPASQTTNECDDEEDDGDELVLSDYGSDDDVH